MFPSFSSNTGSFFYLLHCLTSKLFDSAVMPKYDCDIGAMGGCIQ